MNDFRTQLNVPVLAAGAGTVTDVSAVRDKTVEISGTFSATVTIEGSIASATGPFFPLFVGVTAPGQTSFAQSVKWLRVNVSSYVSGQPVAWLAGFGVRDC